MINRTAIKEVGFIRTLKADLEELRTKECFNRHTPDYYEERIYYNWFHESIPKSLLLSKCYLAFVELYIQNGESLFVAIKRFIEVYENESME